MASNYKNATVGSKDPLRRLSHNSRYLVAKSLIDPIGPQRVMDFGGGDGAFLSLLGVGSGDRAVSVLFEPYMQAEVGQFVHATTWEQVQSIAAEEPFDVISCQEVMEHLNPQRQVEALDRIAAVMAPAGRLILSVPQEMGPVALVKNIGRWKFKKNHPQVYTAENLWKSLFGIPIPECRTEDKYLSHMGFYYTDLRRLIEQRFVVERVVGSPFLRLPLLLNSQVFFVCRPKN